MLTYIEILSLLVSYAVILLSILPLVLYRPYLTYITPTMDKDITKISI